MKFQENGKVWSETLGFGTVTDVCGDVGVYDEVEIGFENGIDLSVCEDGCVAEGLKPVCVPLKPLKFSDLKNGDTVIAKAFIGYEKAVVTDKTENRVEFAFETGGKIGVSEYLVNTCPQAFKS